MSWCCSTEAAAASEPFICDSYALHLISHESTHAILSLNQVEATQQAVILQIHKIAQKLKYTLAILHLRATHTAMCAQQIYTPVKQLLFILDAGPRSD